MHACKVDLDKLRQNLESYLENELDAVRVNNREHEEPRPTAGFQRVLQRAMLHVDSSGDREVTGANVLAAAAPTAALEITHGPGALGVEALAQDDLAELS